MIYSENMCVMSEKLVVLLNKFSNRACTLSMICNDIHILSTTVYCGPELTYDLFRTQVSRVTPYVHNECLEFPEGEREGGGGGGCFIKEKVI